jgi:integrase
MAAAAATQPGNPRVSALPTARATVPPPATVPPASAPAPPPAATSAPKAPKRERGAPRKAEMKGLILRGDIWYFVKMVKGERFRESLGTADLALARKRRDALLARLCLEPEKVLAERRNLPTDIRTLGQLTDLYYDYRTPSNDLTRESNCRALLRIAGDGSGKAHVATSRESRLQAAAEAERRGWREIPVSALNKGLVAEFFRSRVARAGKDPKARHTAINSARSLLASARSCFSHREAFGLATLPPGVEEFCRAKTPTAPRDHRFRPLSGEEGAALIAGAELLRADNPRLRICYLLMLYCGCRNCEVAAAQWEWFKPRKVRCQRGGAEVEEVWNYLHISEYSYFTPKQSLREVPVRPDVLAELRTLAADAAAAPPGQQWLLGPETSSYQREQIAHRDFSKWFRTILPNRTPYDLRKQAGSIVAETDPRGIWAAKAFLGHKQITTTESHYASPIAAIAGVTELKWGA